MVSSLQKTKGFGKPKPIQRRSYLIEFKRRYPDGSELDLWWWKVSVPKLNSSATEEKVAQLICSLALDAFQHLKGVRKPNLIYLLSADGRWTLGEGFLGHLDGGEVVDQPMLARVLKAKEVCHESMHS